MVFKNENNRNKLVDLIKISGLALLFDRSGGQITKKMGDVIAKVGVSDRFHQHMIKQVKEIWDTWNLKVSKWVVKKRPMNNNMRVEGKKFLLFKLF